MTEWQAWFITRVKQAVDSAHQNLDSALVKAHFWQRWAQTPMNERQVALLNRALDGYEGRLTSGKWAKLANCSLDTAVRDIQQLVTIGVLRQVEGGGRNTA